MTRGCELNLTIIRLQSSEIQSFGYLVEVCVAHTSSTLLNYMLEAHLIQNDGKLSTNNYLLFFIIILLYFTLLHALYATMKCRHMQK